MTRRSRFWRRVVLIAAVLGILIYFNRATVLTLVADTIGLWSPFTGLTSDGVVTPGLFVIEPTGVPTDAVLVAARTFLDGLSDEQRAETMFPLNSDEWRRWMNIHLYDRRGMGFIDMTPQQKALGYALLESGLSERGYAQVRDIMRLDTTLGELKGNDFEWFGEERYWITVMGEPDAEHPWGWQLDGHHLIINYFLLGDQVVMSPVFLGAEPVVASSGVHAGVAVLQEEQNQGLAFIQTLSQVQRDAAVLADDKPGNNAYGEFYSDNEIVPLQGVSAGTFDDAQAQQFLDLIRLYVGHMSSGHAAVKMAEVTRFLDDTFFVWMGGQSDTEAYYYRIQSPVIMIEFDHQRPVGLATLTGDRSPTREHIHAIMRTPNGNDYGKDLLRQHYERHPH